MNTEVATTPTIQRETFEAVYHEALPLLEAHREEIAHYKDIPLHVDVAFYQGLEAAGGLRIFTVRQEGRLIGYCAVFVRPNAHYCDSLQAMQDVLYVAKEHRHGRLGYQLIRYVEEALRNEGVQVLYQHVKTTNQVEQLLERMGYELMDYIYTRRLDDYERR